MPGAGDASVTPAALLLTGVVRWALATRVSLTDPWGSPAAPDPQPQGATGPTCTLTIYTAAKCILEGDISYIFSRRICLNSSNAMTINLYSI